MDMENLMLKCSAWYLYYYFNNNELIFEMHNLIASKMALSLLHFSTCAGYITSSVLIKIRA